MVITKVAPLEVRQGPASDINPCRHWGLVPAKALRRFWSNNSVSVKEIKNAITRLPDKDIAELMSGLRSIMPGSGTVRLKTT